MKWNTTKKYDNLGRGYWKIKNNYGFLGRKIILGIVAIWDNRKDYDDFVRLSEMINADNQIVLVGLNEEQIRNLPANIIGFGKTNNIDELISLYSIADIYVNPTYEDNLIVSINHFR